MKKLLATYFTPALLCAGLLAPCAARATYYIHDDAAGGDCALIGSWDGATRTCTLTTDIHVATAETGISVQASDITIDGGGHRITGPGELYSYGIGNSGTQSNVTIRNVVIGGFFGGVFLDNVHSTTIANLTVTGSWAAVWVDASTDATIVDNQLVGDYQGVRLEGVSRGLVKGNTITQGGNTAIGLAYGTSDVTVTRNVVTHWFYHVLIQQSDRNTINGNVFQESSDWQYRPAAIGLIEGSWNRVFNNDFLDTARPFVLDGFGNTGDVFNLDAPIGGNYWNDVPCADGNGDGFCDAPVVFSGGSDQLPLATPASGRLAADVTPPVTQVSLDAAPGNGGWLRSAVTVTLTATDDSSGVARTVYSVDGGSTWNTSTGPFVLSQEGTTTLQFYSVDVAGNAESIHSVPLRIDMTPPFTSSSAPAQGSEFILNQPVLAAWSVSDPISGICSASAPVPNGSPLDTSAVGARTFPIAAEDCAGNSATVDISWAVRYAFGGFVAPVDPSGSSIFNLGRPVPIRFSLTDYQGVPVSAAVAELFVAKVSDAILGTELQADSMAAATSGNLFWYDPVAQQYVFVLDTRPLARGTWQLRIALDDGSSHTVNVSLQ